MRERFDFHDAAMKRRRVDEGYPWQLEGANRLGPRSHLEDLTELRRAVRRATGREFKDRWEEHLGPHLEKIYEARSLLSDHASKILFDQAALLRALGFGKFFYPRIDFDDMIEVVSDKPFALPGFPLDYIGMPLREMELFLPEAGAGRAVKVFSPRETIDLLNSHRQYFIQRDGLDFKPRAGEVVLDCGACIGELSAIFAGYVGPGGQVHAFDPIPLHLKFCAEQAKLNPSLSGVFKLVPEAVGAATSKGKGFGKADSDRIEPGGLKIDDFDTVSLDDYVLRGGVERVSMVKMDIEGAEIDALNGAKRVIRAHRPKLAISTYHRRADFWEIPLLIKAIEPSYKMAFGHHTPTPGESVVYSY